MSNNTYSLEERQIINYLRKNASNNENQNNIRNKLLSLFFETINNIPILEKREYYKIILKEFPSYFHLKTREEIIELFNKEVCLKNPIIYNYNLITNYNINSNSYLNISIKTFRPIYEDDWKEKTKIINGVSIDNQQSFYAEYLRYYLKFKKFPEFNDYINYIYNKYKKPLHKDILNVFNNIEKSYSEIKEYIKNNNLNYIDIKSIIINSTSIENRKKLQI